LAGEKSGNLSGVLEYYIAYQRVTTGLRKKLIATLIYPTILVCAATLIVTYLVSTVIPKFALLYGDLNINLPAATRILLAITVTYRPFLLAAIGIVVVLALAAFAWSRSDKEGWRWSVCECGCPWSATLSPSSNSLSFAGRCRPCLPAEPLLFRLWKRPGTRLADASFGRNHAWSKIGP